MDLGLGGSVNRMEIAFPGRSCACIQTLTLSQLSPDGNNTVLWSIDADDGGKELPVPVVVGEVPQGFHETTALRSDTLAELAASNPQLEFLSSVGTTQPFRLSEMSATGRIVEIGHSRSVTDFQDMRQYVEFYRADHAKEDRGHRRYTAFLVAVLAVGLVIGQVVTRRRRKQAAHKELPTGA